MELGFLFRGLIIGFSIAAPVGPIGVLCIRRTVAGGFIRGITAGLGTAAADGVYGSVAAFGLTAVTSFLVDQQTLLRLVGGASLCYLGVKIIATRPKDADKIEGPPAGPGEKVNGVKGLRRLLSRKLSSANEGHFGGVVATFFLTITNPMTILAFTAVFAGLGLGDTAGDFSAAALLVLGVFSGSALWWLVLCAATGFFRKMISPAVMRAVNVVSGVVIAGFGIYAIVSVL
ncbi:MAG: LysE family transporter [Deltaproteobacteria bacterium]|nr:LysE family transporter [Candidatus Zymogenaceae bacterium]